MTPLKSFAYSLVFPNTVIVYRNDVSQPVVSMIMSTILTCALIQFVPSLMPLWMAGSTGAKV